MKSINENELEDIVVQNEKINDDTDIDLLVVKEKVENKDLKEKKNTNQNFVVFSYLFFLSVIFTLFCIIIFICIFIISINPEIKEEEFFKKLKIQNIMEHLKNYENIALGSNFSRTAITGIHLINI
jgi:hypothetical protein